MVTLEQQATFVEEAPEIFLPIPGGWVRMGQHAYTSSGSERGGTHGRAPHGVEYAKG
jgi:hypothetical protein